MHHFLSLRSLKTLPPKTPSLLLSFFSLSSQPHHHNLVSSPARVQKLIASQSDPLLAKGIFAYVTAHSYFTLILKLARARYFSLSNDLILRLKSHPHISPSLFTHLIKIYSQSNLLLSLDMTSPKPSPKVLNRLKGIRVDELWIWIGSTSSGSVSASGRALAVYLHEDFTKWKEEEEIGSDVG